MSHLRLLPGLPSVAVTSDEACLEAFQQELDYILRALRRMGVPSAEVEDLAHEVFLVLRKKWAEYDSTRPLRPYLFGIAFRIAAAHQRKRVREVHHFAIPVEGQDPMQPERAFQIKQARALLLAALDEIPLPRRAVLIMHDIDDLPMQEIAASLSIPLFTAYSRLRKARKELAIAARRLMKADAPQ